MNCIFVCTLNYYEDYHIVKAFAKGEEASNFCTETNKPNGYQNYYWQIEEVPYEG